MADHPIIFSGQMVRALLDGGKTMTRRLATSPLRTVKPFDRLWVRESLTHVTSDPVTAEDCSIHCYTASIPAGMGSANPYEPNYLFANDGDPALKPKSIPSIHMPRWASRLTLVVREVKVERLQDISKADVMAEGIHERDGAPMADVFAGWHEPFAALWERLHGAGSWDANPEVVAISFRVIRANIDAPEAIAA